MVGVGASEMFGVWMLLLGGMGLPRGLPPEAEDPMLARIAPPQCLAYVTWAGTAQPNASSTNETERLLAEPEVQRTIRGFEKMLKNFMHEGGGGGPGPEAALALEWGLKIAARPGAAYLADLDPARKKVEAGIMLRLGEEEASSLKRLLMAMQKQAPLTVAEKKVAGETFFVVTMKEPGAPPVTWGVRQGYVVFGIGENALENMLARAERDAVPEWLVAAKKKAAIERLSTLTYVNVKAALELAGPQLAQVLPPEAAKAAGLANVTEIISATGLDKTGFVNRTLLGTQGVPEGFLATLVDEPITAKDLAPIPADASIALAGRLNLEKLQKKIVQVFGEVDPRAGQEIEMELRRFEAQSGIDVRGELLPGLGDVWRVWVSPSEGGILSPTMVVNVRDRDRVQNALAAAERILAAEFNPGPGRARIVRERVGGVEVCTMRGQGMPFAPSWCVTEKELILSTFPQAIRGYLRRDASFKSLATVAEAAAAVETGASAVSYADTKQIFEMSYPWVQMMLTMAANSMDPEMQFDAGILPPLSSLMPHLRPAVGTVRKGPSGIEFTSRQTFPGGAGLTSISPVTVAFLLPAIGTARAAAQQNVSMNNMKQILLAFHNHADTFRAFPGAFTMKADEKPLLSWRVRILPFIEQQALQQQFKMDEPWDSEHNKALLETIPAVFRNPRSTAPAGHTTYLGVRGKSGTFEKGDLIENGQIKKNGGISFANVTDGTSNTIGVVEVTDEFAVPWTKPDDFDFATADFQKALFGNRGTFIAGFLDGHVETIANGVGKKTLLALFTRDGGEVVNLDDVRNGRAAARAEAEDRIAPDAVPDVRPANPPPAVPGLRTVPAPTKKAADPPPAKAPNPARLPELKKSVTVPDFKKP